jgi:hypothetical protein
MKKYGANAVFWAAVISEILIVAIYIADVISFLWLNVIGCLLVVLITLLLHYVLPRKAELIQPRKA